MAGRSFALLLACLGAAPWGSTVRAQRPTAPAVRETTVDGVFTSFYGNGVIRERGPLDAAGARTGTWRTFWPSGRLAGEGDYRAGERWGVWTWRDVYGRPAAVVIHGERGHSDLRPLPPSTPLRLADLRQAAVGATTVGALCERFAAAEAGDAALAERRDVARELAGAPVEAVAVPLALGAALPPGERTPWLELAAGMPMPPWLPHADLLAWCEQPECANAAETVLTAWSRQFANDWQPLLDAGPGDPNRWSKLQALGPKAFGALPELRRRLAPGAGPDAIVGLPIGHVLLALRGTPARSLEPWLARLDDAEAGRRAEAAHVLAALAATAGFASAIEPALVLRLLADAQPAVVDAGTWLLVQCGQADPAAFDGALATLAQSPVPTARVFAAWRRLEANRVDEAVAMLAAVAGAQPELLDRFPVWDRLAEASAHPDAKALLVAAAERGNGRALRAFDALVGSDPRAFELAVAGAGSRWWAVRWDTTPAETLQRLRERLWPRLAAADTPPAERVQLWQNLWAIAGDERSRRDLLDAAFAAPDDGLRMLAFDRARWSGLAPTTEQWRAILAAPATQARAIAVLAEVPLPDGLDPTPFPVPAVVLATWADGRPERVRALFDRWLRRCDDATFDALVLLRADFATVADRVPAPPLVAQWPRSAALRERLPDLAAELRIRTALQGQATDSIVCRPLPPGGMQRLAIQPIDAALLAAVERRLRSEDAARRGEALALLPALGLDGAPLLPALEAVQPRLAAAELALLPGILAAIAPAALPRICEPLLDHADPTVVAAVLRGPVHWQSAGIPGGGRLATAIARRIVAGDADASPLWLAILGDAAAALPVLQPGLRDHPTSAAIVAALGALGPAASTAERELWNALDAGNAAAAPVLLGVLLATLPPERRAERCVELLDSRHGGWFATSMWGERIDDLAALERLAGDERIAVRDCARSLLAASASASAEADRVRVELLSTLAHGYQGIGPEHAERLWPRLGSAARQALLALFGGRRDPVALPEPFAAVLARELDDGAAPAHAFDTLVACAPLHPAVLERIAAADAPWNAPQAAGAPGPRTTHAYALLRQWRSGDAALRERLAPWLSRHAGHVGQALQKLRADGEWTLLDALGVCAVIGEPPYEVTTIVGMALGDEDLAVRREAMRTLAAVRPLRDALLRDLQPLLLEATFEERFGPFDGLPPVCREVAAAVPTAEQRAAKLRELLAPERVHEAHAAIAADPPAARILVPELAPLLAPRQAARCLPLLQVLQRLGPAAAALAPSVEALVPIPALHFAALAALRSMRGEGPADGPRGAGR